MRVQPLVCNSWECPECAKVKKARLELGLRYGIQLANEQRKVALLTLTYRWKPKGWTDKRWFANFKNEFPQVGTRLRSSPEQWKARLQKDWENLMIAWKRSFGLAPDYIRVYELTKAGCPHIHAVLLIGEQNGTEKELPGWLGKTWARISKDGDPRYCTKITFRGGKHRNQGEEIGKIVTGPKSAVLYCTKYLAKDLNKLEENRLKWPKRRRYNRSQGFPFADLGEKEAFMLNTGETMNRKEYNRLRGKWYNRLEKYTNETNYDPAEYANVYASMSKEERTEFEWYRYMREHRMREYENFKGDFKQEELALVLGIQMGLDPAVYTTKKIRRDW